MSVPFFIPTSNYWEILLLYTLTCIWFCSTLDFHQLYRFVWYINILIYNSLNDVLWASFICLFSIYVFSLVRCPFKYFAHFLIGLFTFLLLNAQEFFVYFGLQSFFRYIFCKIFFQPAACLLIFLTLFSEEHKFLTLMKFRLSIISFMDCIFYLLSFQSLFKSYFFWGLQAVMFYHLEKFHFSAFSVLHLLIIFIDLLIYLIFIYWFLLVWPHFFLLRPCYTQPVTINNQY